MDCSAPGSSVHGILQARILVWVAISSSRGSSRSRDWTHISCVSCIAADSFATDSLGKPRSQKSVKITFICIGKPKIQVTHFITMFTLLQWSGTKPTTSPIFHKLPIYESTQHSIIMSLNLFPGITPLTLSSLPIVYWNSSCQGKAILWYNCVIRILWVVSDKSITQELKKIALVWGKKKKLVGLWPEWAWLGLGPHIIPFPSFRSSLLCMNFLSGTQEVITVITRHSSLPSTIWVNSMQIEYLF